MKITGANILAVPGRPRSGTRCSTRGCWSRTIPGCERLEATGENAYAMTVTAGVAAIKGTYAGLLRALRPRAAPVAGDAAAGRRRARHDRRDRQRAASARPSGGTTDRLRRRRGRRRHGRRRRPADADLGLEADGRGVLRQRRAALAGARPRSPRPAPVVARPGGGAVGARPGPASSPRPPKPAGVALPGRLPQGHRRRRRAGAARRRRRRDLRPPAPMSGDLSVDSTAREQAAAVRGREISARELLDLHLARIAERNPRAQRDRLARRGARPGGRRGGRRGAGLRAPRSGRCTGCRSRSRTPTRSPGWRTTYGSPLFADHVPDADELIVERVRRAGVVVIGKTNVPEFAAGSHTFNTVFGTTLNPVDPTRSAGGSSGGAACALASGMVPLADGSDMGGSLRNPASFCGVVGLRPSLGPGAGVAALQPVGDHLGRRPDGAQRRRPRAAALGDGRPRPAGPAGAGRPGRDVRAAAVGLAGRPAGRAVGRPRRRLRGRRRGRGGGRRRRPSVFTGAGASVVAAHPDLAEADDTFRTLRAWHFQAKLGPLLAAAPRRVQAVARRQHPARGVAHRRRRRRAPTPSARRSPSGCGTFFTSYDVLVLPVSQVPPFPADQEFPHRDQRPADGDLPGLDARGVLHHRHRLPRDLGAGRHHPRRAAGRDPDRRRARRGPAPARGRGGVRAGRRSSGPRGWLPRIGGRAREAAEGVRRGRRPAARFWACCPIPSAARRRCARTTSASTGPRRRSDPSRAGAPRCCTTVDLMLGNRFPVTLLWGPELVLVYNQAYVELIADKHPARAGRPGARTSSRRRGTRSGRCCTACSTAATRPGRRTSGCRWTAPASSRSATSASPTRPCATRDGEHRGRHRHRDRDHGVGRRRPPAAAAEPAVQRAGRRSSASRTCRPGRWRCCRRPPPTCRPSTSGSPGCRARTASADLPDRPADRSTAHGPAGRGATRRAGSPGSRCRAERRAGSTLAAGGAAQHHAPDATTTTCGFLALVAAAISQALTRVSAREAERSLSEALQRSLLTQPPGSRRPRRWPCATSPPPRQAQVGGDWYDAFLLPDGALTMVVGDVAGHDQDAAASMGQLRNLVRGVAYSRAGDAGGGAARARPRDGRPRRRRHRDRGAGPGRAAHADGGGPVAAALVERRAPAAGADRRRRDAARLLETDPDLLLGLDHVTERGRPRGRRWGRATRCSSTPTGSSSVAGSRCDEGLDWLRRRRRGPHGLDPEELCDHLLGLIEGRAEDDIALLVVRSNVAA